MAVEFHEVFCRMLGKYTLHAPKWQERSLAAGYENCFQTFSGARVCLEAVIARYYVGVSASEHLFAVPDVESWLVHAGGTGAVEAVDDVLPAVLLYLVQGIVVACDGQGQGLRYGFAFDADAVLMLACGKACECDVAFLRLEGHHFLPGVVLLDTLPCLHEGATACRWRSSNGRRARCSRRS